MPADAVFYVYEHWRPDTGVCFYVGKGKKQRAWEMTKRNRWHKAIVSKLVSLGYCVDVRMIATGLNETAAHALEIALIASRPPKTLCNLTAGGEGVSGLVMSAEARRKMAAKKLGTFRGPHSAEHREKIGAAQRGKVLLSEHRAKLSEARRKRVVSAATREKMRAIMLAKPAEWHASRVKSLTGRPVSDETRRKMSTTHTGKTISMEQRAKISATLTGKKLTPEHVENIKLGKIRRAQGGTI